MRAIITLLVTLFAAHVHAQKQNTGAQTANNKETGYIATANSPGITFPANVDVSSYGHARRCVNSGINPDPASIHIEEMINYFDYKYPQPTGDAPLAINTELTTCPWNKDHKLLRVSMQVRKTNAAMLPPSNLVLLINISPAGSQPDKLPVFIEGMKKLVKTLRPKDKVTLLTCSATEGQLLPATSGLKKEIILDALEKLTPGNNVNECHGISLAYRLAQEQFIKEGNNRILLVTDNDIDIEPTYEGKIHELIKEKQAAGVYLSVLDLSETDKAAPKIITFAAEGGGNYKHAGDIKETQHALCDELYGTKLVVARNASAHVYFNPLRVAGYRMMGSEDDTMNKTTTNEVIHPAETLLAGHATTVLFEIIPNTEPGTNTITTNKDLAAIKWKYTAGDNNVAEISSTIPDRTVQWDHASEHTRFAVAVAICGMLLADSRHAYNTCFEDAMKFAKGAMTYDNDGYREEFIKLVRRAKNNDINASLVR